MTDYTNPPAYPFSTAAPAVQGPQVQNGQNPPMVAIQGGYPVPMYAYPNLPTVYGSYQCRKSRNLGIIQIVVGALCIVFNSVAIPFDAMLSPVAVGIWGGILFIVTGSFGISAAKLRTKCKITTYMVLCLVSAACTVALFLCAVLSAAFQGQYYFHCHNSGGHYYYDYFDCQAVAIAMNSVLAVLAVAEALAATWGSVLCCKVYGCCNTSDNQVMMAPGQQAAMQGSQPLIIIPLSQLNFGGQVAYAPGYTNQQVADISAPPYPSNQGVNTVQSPLVPQTNTNNNDDMEKIPL